MHNVTQQINFTDKHLWINYLEVENIYPLTIFAILNSFKTFSLV